MEFSALSNDIGKVVKGTFSNATRALLNSLYPDEFEYYLFTLELMTSDGKLLDNLLFPVMPTSINESRLSLVNVKKTNSAVVSLINNTFAPTSISINGTFGKKIRILLGNKQENATAFSSTLKSKTNDNELNTTIKTGYGVTKLLESILKKSQKNKDYLLFLYNHSFNANYLVECEDMSFSQSMENNMFWNYQLTFKTLAKAEDVYPTGKEGYKNSIKHQLTYSVFNNTIFQLERALNKFKAERNELSSKLF